MTRGGWRGVDKAQRASWTLAKALSNKLNDRQLVKVTGPSRKLDRKFSICWLEETVGRGRWVEGRARYHITLLDLILL